MDLVLLIDPENIGFATLVVSFDKVFILIAFAEFLGPANIICVAILVRFGLDFTMLY